MRIRFMKILVVSLALSMAFVFACSQNADEEPQKQDDSMVVQLQVQNDDLFGFDLYEKIGKVFLSDSRGPVGSPVEVVVIIDEIERFDENVIDFSIVLKNPDAIRGLVQLEDDQPRRTSPRYWAAFVLSGDWR